MADIFSSKSKFKVLKLLIQCEKPIPLRTISSLVNLPIRSVVLALEALLSQEIVRESWFKRNRLFQVNTAHPFSQELKDIFSQIEKSEIKIRSQTYQREASKAFKFAQSANRFLSGNK